MSPDSGSRQIASKEPLGSLIEPSRKLAAKFSFKTVSPAAPSLRQLRNVIHEINNFNFPNFRKHDMYELWGHIHLDLRRAV
jgi:hypothetical protein